jgi:hypothetical protein
LKKLEISIFFLKIEKYEFFMENVRIEKFHVEIENKSFDTQTKSVGKI